MEEGLHRVELYTEAISDSLMCLDDVSSEFLSEISYVYFDDLLICPGVIDSPYFLCELALGEYTWRVLHEVEEEFIFTL